MTAEKSVNPVSIADMLETTTKYVKKEPSSIRLCSMKFNSVEENVYDSMLPKRENLLLSRIRRWEKRMGFITPLLWTNLISISAFHILGIVVSVTYLLSGYMPKWQTLVFGFLMGQIAGFGITAGVHRYWTHRSYKAKLPLQIILLICYSTAGQNNIYDWVRDHRVHHKFSETVADPHNANRGIFFSHVGWLMMKKHPAVIKEGSKIDMNDISNDPLVQFHTKYFNLFKIILCFALPTVIPRLWGETWMYCVISQPILRYMCILNFTWSVNSFAHIWGNKPYDKYIMPAENWFVSLVAMGEGWHNYHHTFPWDYKAAELPYTINVTTFLLDLFTKIGWAYDRREASESLVNAIVRKKGDGTKKIVNT